MTFLTPFLCNLRPGLPGNIALLSRVISISPLFPCLSVTCHYDLMLIYIIRVTKQVKIHNYGNIFFISQGIQNCVLHYVPCVFTTQKMKDFFSKSDQIHSFLWIWSHLVKKALMENFIFCVVLVFPYVVGLLLWHSFSNLLKINLEGNAKWSFQY